MNELFCTKISVFSPDMEELGVKQQTVWVDLAILKSEIIGVRDNPPNEEKEGAIIYTRGGDSFVTNENYLDVYREIFIDK